MVHSRVVLMVGARVSFWGRWLDATAFAMADVIFSMSPSQTDLDRSDMSRTASTWQNNVNDFIIKRYTIIPGVWWRNQIPVSCQGFPAHWQLWSCKAKWQNWKTIEYVQFGTVQYNLQVFLWNNYLIIIALLYFSLVPSFGGKPS